MRRNNPRSAAEGSKDGAELRPYRCAIRDPAAGVHGSESPAAQHRAHLVNLFEGLLFHFNCEVGIIIIITIKKLNMSHKTRPLSSLIRGECPPFCLQF